MMTPDLPDAPWIRQAELFGPPEPENVYCPACYEENPEWLYVQYGEILGCSCCISREDPFDLLRQEKVYCPVCNEENPEWFYLQAGEILGCSCCISREDPFNYIDKCGVNPYE